MRQFDIAIIGGGLAGLTLSILLGNQGHRIICIDREKPEIGKDTRTTAISWGSRNLLKNTGIWADLESNAECISDILIKDEDSPIQLDFNSSDIDAEGFGWIVDNRDIRKSLLSHVQNHDLITHVTGECVEKFNHHCDNVTITTDGENQYNAKLVVGADGRKSFTRDHMNIDTWTHDYKESAVVCLINHTKPHHGLALEHFRTQGPFAVLPYTDDKNGNHRSAIVWTVPKNEVHAWMDCDDEIFNAALQTRCGDLYGDITMTGTRAAWPLNIVKAKSYIGNRMVLVAEAAHGIHPIAGQGLNMSFRDLAALAEILEGKEDPGQPDLLKTYQKMRRTDNASMAGATHILNHLFESNLVPIRALRRFGLHAICKLPFAKRFFMKQAMGRSGNLPKMIKQAA